MNPNSTERLYFEASGRQTGTPIVFLHGGGAAGWMWREQVKALEAEYRCLIPDLPEQGQSLKIAPYTTERAADLVANLIATESPEGKAHVVGLSEGAQVTVALLSRNPQVIDHAVVSSAILRPLPGNRLYTRGLIAATHRWFIEPFKKNDWWIRLNMKYSAGIPEPYYEDFKRSFAASTVSSTVNMLYGGMHFRMPAGLDKANVPVLVVVGSKEYKEMKQSARDLLGRLPNARGAMVSLGPKATLAMEHNWAMTAPALFTATIKAWIEDRPLPDEIIRM